MYEQVSHAVLNKILDELNPEIRKKELRFFYSRLGANFYAIYSLFQKLYGDRDDFYPQLKNLVEVMAIFYINRPKKYKRKDIAREKNSNWFLDQNWVGMALYANGFADNLADLDTKIDYFSELGVNIVHILPILECPVGKSDGGYAVKNFRKVDERLGTNEDLKNIITKLHDVGSLIALDMVVNHTSNEHEWAVKAKQGDERYQNFYYTFDTRDIPDLFEQSMLEVFPENDPGNFTWNDDMKKWVMTVFHNYQWDLNYTNPAVLIGMLSNILYWANEGVDILRLDAVAFLWKKIGSVSQNEEEAHLILQLFKDCCQIVSPGLLFIAEAIVAPSEITKYFGEDAVVAKECEIAYNATYMALLWDSVATKNSRLLYQGLKSIPSKLDGATWLNYLRCHDDIGFGFNDSDMPQVGYDPALHRRFLVDYFTGSFEGSNACGVPFGKNEKTGDARISGSLASLIGLEHALKNNDQDLIDKSCQHIILLHALIMSFGGIPLLYYGDEIATLNDYNYKDDAQKANDSRWLHRPRIDWNKAENRFNKGSTEYRIFNGLKKLIAIRKAEPGFADFNNRDLISTSNDALFCFTRYRTETPTDTIIVIANMSDKEQRLHANEINDSTYTNVRHWHCIYDMTSPTIIEDQLVLPPFKFLWLKRAV